MSDLQRHEMAEVRISGKETANNTVPLDVLVRVLEGLQQTALLLTAAETQPPVLRRFRPSDEMRRRCELRCGPLTPGSVAVSIRTSFPVTQPSLYSEKQENEGPLSRLLGFVGAVARGDADLLARLVPDSRFRSRLLRETMNFLPRAGQTWAVELQNGQDPIRLDVQTRQTLDECFREVGEAEMVLTGQLTRIDFEKNKVVIRHPVTKKTIQCDYEVDAEDGLIKKRREWVQVHGKFELDKDGNPRKAIEVTRIELPLDLSPFTVDLVKKGKVSLQFTPSLYLTPVLDEESKQLLVVEDESLNLHAFAYTRELLEDEIEATIWMLWQEYALEDPDNLTEKAQGLRETLRDRIQEMKNAPP